MTQRRWSHGVDRLVLGTVAGTGLSVGAVVLALPGRSPLVIGLMALGIGAFATVALVLDLNDPLPFLYALSILAAVASPLVDREVIPALHVVLVAVLATGILLAPRERDAWGLVGITVIAALVGVVVGTGQGVIAVLDLAVIAGVTIVFRRLRSILMRRHEHQEEMNRFVTAVAHNLRTPLTAVIGYSYLIAGSLDDGELTDWARNVVHRAWEVSWGLDDLLVIARDRAAGLEMLRRPVALSPLVKSVLEDGAKAEYVDVHGVALGDPVRISQIVRHLLSNALEHGGPRVWLSTRRAGDQIVLSVHDSGHPLPPEELEMCFEPFYTGPHPDGPPGRGIGLTVSRILARNMDGDVRLRSDPDGTTAELWLPADPTALDPSRAGVLRRAARRGSETSPPQHA